MQTRTLGLEAEREKRLARIHEPHVEPLTAFVTQIEQQMRCWTPYFDPESGGVKASVLLLLESPGPKVSQTCFVSQDNPDQTAENMTQVMAAAELSRYEAVLWNIVPCQLSAERVITPTAVQLREAAQYTLKLLELMPELRAIVLVGRKAQAGWKHILPLLPLEYTHLQLFNCPHPSPQNFNSRPDQREEAVRVLREVAARLKQ